MRSRSERPREETSAGVRSGKGKERRAGDGRSGAEDGEERAGADAHHAYGRSNSSQLDGPKREQCSGTHPNRRRT